MVHSFTLKILLNLPIIPTNMPRIPPIAPAPILPTLARWKRRRRAFQRHIARAHNRLPHVLEAVVDVPGHFYGMCWRRRGLGLYLEDIVCFDDSVEAVQLVGYAGGEDGMVGVVMDRVGEIVVLRGVGDVDVA